MAHDLLEIDDRVGISDLLIAYSWAIDEGRSESVADLFLPEGRFTGSDGNVTHGREALVAFASRVHGAHPGRLQHITSNLVFLPHTPTRVTVRSYVQVLLAQAGGPRLLAAGSYRDEVVKSDGSWFFVSRSFENWRDDVQGPGIARP